MMIRKNVLAAFLAALISVGVLALVVGGFVVPVQGSEVASIVVVPDPPASGRSLSMSQYQVVTPTPGTGSVVVVTQSQALGSGSTIPQYQVVVPGPNPAQNTGVGMGQQLSTPGNTGSA
jgi:uncharacterized membrane protein YdfJ with MMPL/SSD domain